MPHAPAHSRSTTEKAQREVAGSTPRPAGPQRRRRCARRADAALHRLRPAEGQLLLHRRRRVRGSDPGRPDRSLQGGARLSLRQGDVVPELRRALHHAPDHHRHQDGDSLQARAAEHVRLLQPDAGRPGGLRRDARRRARRARASTTRSSASSRPRSSRASFSRSARASRSSSPTRCASTSRASPTSRWPRSSAATRRRSTTPSSA